MSERQGLRELADGERLWSPGEPIDRLFLVQKGCVELCVEAADQPRALAELGPGDMVAPPASLEAAGPLCLRARGPARVLTLDMTELEQQLREDPALSRTVIQGLSRTNARLSAQLASTASYVYVVPRDRPELFERLQQELAADPQVTVVLDRREGERRQGEEPERQGPGRRGDPGWSVYLSQPFKPGRGRFLPIQRKKGE